MAYIGAAPDGQGSAERFIFTATGSTTDTVTHDDSGLAINYEANHVSVYLNGVKQVVGTDVTASNGSTLVFASNLSEDDVVEAIALSSYSPADTVPAATGGTFAGAVTFSAGLTANTADINAGTVDGATIGASSHSTGKFTTCDATTDFTIGGLVITDNTITDDGTLTITATTGITLGQDTALAAGKDIETSTTGKIKQKGAFMQSSTHQALTLGY